MYYRRKLLLSILEKTQKRSIVKIDLRKILFSISQRQPNPSFDFVPYKNDSISFQADKDLETLCHRYHLLKDSKKSWSLIDDQGNYFDSLKREDQDILNNIFKAGDIKKIKTDPYCISYSMPDQKKKQQSKKEKPPNNQKLLFSIGYEGLSIDAYLKRLVENYIALLCDVRANPLSLKFGFSKRQLSAYCHELGIKYIHMPELGIHSEKRKNLKTKKDYTHLFQEYKRNLPMQQSSLERLQRLLEGHNRLALTCFEKDYQKCHRTVLAQYYLQNIEAVNHVPL